jgi:hypothetical protein
VSLTQLEAIRKELVEDYWRAEARGNLVAMRFITYRLAHNKKDMDTLCASVDTAKMST